MMDSLCQLLGAPHLLDQERHLDDVEVVVQLLDLVEVLLLHLPAGGALLAAASRCPQVRFTGVERDPDALILARENIALNAMTDRVETIEGDVAVRFSSLGLEPFDAAMTNPPFFDDSSALRGPSAEKRAAWMADDGLAAWIGFMSKGVREGGTLTGCVL